MFEFRQYLLFTKTRSVIPETYSTQSRVHAMFMMYLTQSWINNLSVK